MPPICARRCVNQKFVGHLIVIAYWVLLPVMSNLGFDHRLYQIGRPPDFTYSDMAGWGPYLPRILTFRLTPSRSAWRWRRSAARARARNGRRAGRRDGRSRAGSGGGAAARSRRVAFAAAAIALGGIFFYNANALNAYTEVHKAERRVKAWELKYKPLESLPQPRLIGGDAASRLLSRAARGGVARHAHAR